MNRTYLAKVVKDGELEWIESSNYDYGVSLRTALENDGYEVLEIINLEDVKTW